MPKANWLKVEQDLKCPASHWTALKPSAAELQQIFIFVNNVETCQM